MELLHHREHFASVSLLIVMAVVLMHAVLPNGISADTNQGGGAESKWVSAGTWEGVSEDFPVTRWPEESELRPTTYREWKARQAPVTPFRAISRVSIAPDKNAVQNGKFLIIVNEYLQSSIQSGLDQYMSDLTLDGYEVELVASSGGTSGELRAFLYSKYLDGMQGTLLIGDLPIHWHEMTCWVPEEHEQFPCDLYYMDLDGVWTDIDENGMTDEHSGDVDPEIWFGRLLASPMNLNGADEVTLINNYFRKNHLYRIGQLPLANRGLLYVDDDWEESAEFWDSDMGLVYSEKTVLSDPFETVALDYESKLTYNYEMIQACIHSDPANHYFLTPVGSGGTTNVGAMVNIDPQAIFYNLFACSNARFVEYDYMAGWYIFCETFGLGSVGSTKVGAMLNFQEFYGPLGVGRSFGQAFADWYEVVLSEDMADLDKWWLYGMTLCGDPTLQLGLSSCPYLVSYDLSDVSGDSDGIPEKGETIEFRIALKNQGARSAAGVSIGMSINDAVISITRDSAWIGDIGPGNYGTNDSDPLIFEVPEDYVSRIDSFYVSITWNEGLCTDTVALEQVIGGVEILLVDDDDHALVDEFYREYLANSFTPYHIWDAADSSISSVDLDNYSVAVWFTGGYRDELLSASEISAISGYLDNGGNLFLSGQGIAGQLSVSDPAFLNDYLKSDYLTTEYIPLIYSDPGGQVFDFVDPLCITGEGGPGYQTNTDHIEAINGGVTELTYMTVNSGAAVSYSGLYRLVFMSFGLEAALCDNSRWEDGDSVYSDIFDFFQIDPPSNIPRITEINAAPGNPMCLVDKTPDISWIYSDGGGNPQTMYHIQVGTDNFWGWAEMWDYGPVSSSDDLVTYDGLPLEGGRNYYIRIRVFNGSLWSDWRTATIHTNGVPIPTGLTPSYQQEIGNPSPDLTHDVMTDPEGSPLTYSYELYDDQLLTVLVAAAADQPAGVGTTMSWTIPVVLNDGEDYYWRVRTTDTMEVGQWSETAAFATFPTYICGDTNGDGELDVGDAVYIINYVFKGGSSPYPLCGGDANGDGHPNVGDAVYLISYIFKSGPQPVHDCCW